MNNTGFATWRFALWLLAVTVLAAGLRLYRLESPSFFADELFTVSACSDLDITRSKSKILGYVPTAIGLWLQGVSRVDPSEPETWRQLGITETSSRLPACVIGILSVPLLGLATRLLVNARVAGIVALLLALAPWHIYWSQGARFYIQQFLFYNLGLIFFFAATQRRSRVHMLAAMGCVALGFLSQPTAIVIFGVFVLDWLIARGQARSARVGAVQWIALAVTMACVVVLALDVVADPPNWLQFAGRSYQSPLALVLASVYLINVPVALFAIMVGYRLFADRNRLGLYLVLGAVLPIVAYTVAAVFLAVSSRYVFVCLYSWLALAGIGAERLYSALRPAYGRILAGAPLFILLGSLVTADHGYFQRDFGFRPRWREAFAYVAEKRCPGDVVYARLPIVGRYYLEDPTIAGLWQFDPSAEAGHVIWFVFESLSKPGWIDGLAQRRASFEVQVKPSASVEVYLYEPPS